MVAEERRFTRASARLGVSPSALSHTMRRLEEKLGVQLLARSARSVWTTQAGGRLLARPNPAINQISTAVEDLREISGRPSAHIRISAPGEAARRVIAAGIAELRGRPPIPTSSWRSSSSRLSRTSSNDAWTLVSGSGDASSISAASPSVQITPATDTCAYMRIGGRPVSVQPREAILLEQPDILMDVHAGYVETTF